MRILVLATIALLLSGCATLQPTPARESPHGVSDEQSFWWYARFALAWSGDGTPDWHLDPLIAHRIVEPVLEAHRPDIGLWRFHRRAAHDAAGHQFSFIFHADADTARDVYAELADNPILQALQNAERVRLKTDDLTAPTRPDVAATSDPNWSPALAQAWPYYIMGVSEMWLSLVRQYAADRPLAGGADLQALAGTYKHVSARLDETWSVEGQHALLHHLNAVFGYQPLTITERRRVRF